MQCHPAAKVSSLVARLALAVCAAAVGNTHAADPVALRRLEGQHLLLTTDLPRSPQIDGLPAVFDAAVPQWADYFGVEKRATESWRVTACLIGDRQHLAAAGVLPGDLPEFLHGYSRGDQIWFYDQQSDYYRRHLLLHEGTHSFMTHFLGGVGPSWFFEGLAELLATHRTATPRDPVPWTLNYFPARREEVPMLGRIKIVQGAVAARGAPALDAIMRTPAGAFRTNEPYAWCWSAVALFEHHPRYQPLFRRLILRLGDAPHGEAAFADWLQGQMGDQWPLAVEEWQVLVQEMTHGYDFDRMAIVYEAPARAVGEPVAVAVDRGWQSTGIQLKRGQNYQLVARGQFQIALVDGKAWVSEPPGVTIRYHHGRPLGQLLAAIRPAESRADRPSPLVSPVAIGAGAALQPSEAGLLFVRVNESAADLADNQGQIELTVLSAGE